MLYVDFYVPWVAQGMNIRIGRYISLPDIEAQLAPNNPMFTHSILYTFDPFTQQGIVASVKLSPNWTIQLGVSSGNDQSVWDSSARLTGTAMIQWISPSNKDSVYIGINSINDGEFSFNNLQDYGRAYPISVGLPNGQSSIIPSFGYQRTPISIFETSTLTISPGNAPGLKRRTRNTPSA